MAHEKSCEVVTVKNADRYPSNSFLGLRLLAYRKYHTYMLESGRDVGPSGAVMNYDPATLGVLSISVRKQNRRATTKSQSFCRSISHLHVVRAPNPPTPQPPNTAYIPSLALLPIGYLEHLIVGSLTCSHENKARRSWSTGDHESLSNGNQVLKTCRILMSGSSRTC
jgi:hypothetical protein